MTKILIVANPVAGSGRATTIAPIIAKELVSRGMIPSIQFTTANQEDDLLDAAILNADRVIAVGGDGTLHRVARPIVFCSDQTKKIPSIAFFPLGTGNVAARAFRLPRQISDLVDLVVSGTPSWIDVGIIVQNQLPVDLFLLWFGAGLDGAVIHAVTKSRFNHHYQGFRLILQYILETPRVFLTYRFPKIGVKSKQVNGQFASVMIANVGQMGIGGVTRLANPQDGELDLIAIPSQRRLSLCFAGFLAALNALDFYGGISRSRETQIHLSADEPIAIQVDGEPWEGQLPVSIEIRKGAFPLLTPSGLYANGDRSP